MVYFSITVTTTNGVVQTHMYHIPRLGGGDFDEWWDGFGESEVTPMWT